MDKLQTISKSVNEIREALGAECVSIEQLPLMVRALAQDPTKSGFTTTFIFSNKLSPSLPTGDSLNTVTGLVEDLSEDWSQTDSVSKKQSVTSSKTWMSYAIFKSDGTRSTEWSTPINIKGEQGIQGVQGDPGETGPAGPQGEKGVSTSYRTVSAYTSTDTIETPLTPYGGNWIFATNELIPPQSDDENEWFTNADIKDRKKYLWLSQATFNEVGDIVNSWCEPFRLTGEDGQDGVDGSVTEFIYRLLPDYETYKKLSNYLSISGNELYSDPKENDKVPAVNDELNIGTAWTDRPKGINETLQIEVCCTRVRKGINENWGPWSDCVIWSKWGEDGMDGDGVEYIYLITPENINGKKITAEVIADPVNGWMPDRYQASKLDKYQENEFCFDKEHGYEGYTWTDEPSDVGPGEPMEWVSVRKKIDGIWGMFSDPKLWATYSEDGAAYITSFVFKRAKATDTVLSPQGGSFERPLPDNTDWSDSVSSESPDLPVWMSTRTFKFGDNTWDPYWSTPKILSDTANFQVEYKEGVDGEDVPRGLINLGDPKYNGDEAAWRKDHPGWGDENDVTDPMWMATASCKGGVWTDWVVTKIKGEKGEPGPSGSSVQISSKVATLDDLYSAWETFITEGIWPLDKDDYRLSQGEGCFVESEGELYVYNGGYRDGESVDFEIYWFHTKITGEPGKSTYIYIAYSDGLSEDDEIWTNPQRPAAYIGMWYTDQVLDKNSDELTKRSNYSSWIKWSGEDGWGYEQIFLLTSRDLEYNPNGYHPPLPGKQEGDNVAEYLPYHEFGSYAKPHVNPDRYSKENKWSDTPLSPTEEYPFCWVATRKVKGNSFGEWKGDSYDVDGTDRPVAALYSRYTVDGVSGVHIELSNDFAYIPLEDGKIDPDFISGIGAGTIKPVATTVRAYIGDEKVDPKFIYIKENDNVSIIGSTINLKLETIDDSITEIPLEIIIGDRTYEKSWKLFYDNTGYQITTDSIVIRRKADGYLDKENLEITVKKWDGKNFVLSGIPVFATIYFDNGDTPKTLSSSEGEIQQDIAGGTSTIDLNTYEWVSNIRVYVVGKDEYGNYLSGAKQLAFQDIGVVFDGSNGEKGDGALHLELSNDYTIVPTNSDGVIESTWDEEDDEGQDLAISTATLYVGVTEIAADKVTWQWSIVEGDDKGTLEQETTNTCSVLTMEQDAITVRCTATYNGNSISKEMKVVKSKGGPVFKLIPSARLFTYDNDENASPESITFKVSKWNGYSFSEINVNEVQELSLTDDTGNAITSISPTKTEQTVYLKYLNFLVDQETIGWVESGKVGPQGPEGPTGVFSEEDKKALTDAILAIATQNLTDAKTTLEGQIGNAKGDLETAKTNLQTAIDNEKKARESGDAAAAEAAADALKKAQEAAADAAAYVKRLETVEGSIKNLDSKIDTETGKIKDSVLTEEQVYDLSIAALGSKAKVPEGSIAADSVFGQYFAGTVGVFGDLIADNITTSKIRGQLEGGTENELSVYSADNYDNSAWALDSTGKGKLANGAISWDTLGNVTLGSGVTINWSQVGTPTGMATTDDVEKAIENLDIPEGGLTDAQVEAKIKNTSIGANQITTGILDCNNITVTNLKASSITADKITAAQIDFGTGILSGGSATNQVNKIYIGTNIPDSTEQNVLYIVI